MSFVSLSLRKDLGRNKYFSDRERIFQKWNENKGILKYLEFHLWGERGENVFSWKFPEKRIRWSRVESVGRPSGSMDEEEIVKLVKERVAGRSVGRGWRETNEGEVKKKKKYRARFIKGVSWAADSVRIFTEYPTRSSEKCPTPLSIPNHFPSLLKSPKLSPPTAQTTR